jgi:hypothetical protein
VHGYGGTDMTSAKQTRSSTERVQPRPEHELRTYRVFVRVNAVELAELERRRALTGTREMGAYIRAAVLDQRPPQATAPELNRTAWLALAEHLARMQALAVRLEEMAGRPRSALTGLVSRSRVEDAVHDCLNQLRVQSLQIQDLRRTLLGSARRRR